MKWTIHRIEIDISQLWEIVHSDLMVSKVSQFNASSRFTSQIILKFYAFPVHSLPLLTIGANSCSRGVFENSVSSWFYASADLWLTQGDLFSDDNVFNSGDGRSLRNVNKCKPEIGCQSVCLCVSTVESSSLACHWLSTSCSSKLGFEVFLKTPREFTHKTISWILTKSQTWSKISLSFSFHISFITGQLYLKRKSTSTSNVSYMLIVFWLWRQLPKCLEALFN